MQEKLTIVQINVNSWNSNKNSIVKMLQEVDADIALLNEHGCKEQQKIKIQNYSITQTNTLNQRNNGCAIAVKNNLKHRICNDYESDMLSTLIETSLGPIEIATAYIPPRVGHIHYPDFFKLFSKNTAVHFIGDLNGRNKNLGYKDTNTVGKQLETLIDRGHATHAGPHFATYIDYRSHTTPDIILVNKHIMHNTHAVRGPLVTSDHIPIVYTINSAPIQIPIKERPCFKKSELGRLQIRAGTTPHRRNNQKQSRPRRQT